MEKGNKEMILKKEERNKYRTRTRTRRRTRAKGMTRVWKKRPGIKQLGRRRI